MKEKILYQDLQNLLFRISEDDSRAFQALVSQFRDNLFGHAMAFLKDPHKAQDIVQEVFLSIWNNRRNLPAIDNPENYIFIITRNKIASEFRKKILLPISTLITETQTTSDFSIDVQMEQKQLLSLIQKAVDQMPAQRKMVFELGKKEGLKYEEIAEQLNISPNTVKVHMVQALSFIRQFIRKQATILLTFFLFYIFFGQTNPIFFLLRL